MPGPVARLGNWFSHVIKDGIRPFTRASTVPIRIDDVRPTIRDVNSTTCVPPPHIRPSWAGPSVPLVPFQPFDTPPRVRSSRSRQDQRSGSGNYGSSESKAERQNRIFLYLCAAAPAVFFRNSTLSSSSDDDAPLGTSPTSPSLSPTLETPPKRLRYTGSGALMLGLGTLGVLSHKTDSKTPSNTKMNLPFRFRPTVEEQLPIKQKLFKNIQDMFHLSPDVSESRNQSESQAQNSSSSSSVPPSENSSSAKPVFERLVQGDKLVLTEGDITKDQWKALSSFLASCPHITSLRLQGMEITSADADELGPGLKQLRHITFCDNSIGLNDGTLERVVALLLCCGLLESTSIVRNSLGDKHMTELVKLFKHNSLTHVSLCWNGISDPGASQIASAVAVLNTCLKDVDLSYNLVGPDGKGKLLEASRQRIAHFGSALKTPLNIHLRHNEHVKNFKHDFMPFQQPSPSPLRTDSVFLSMNLKFRMNTLFNKENFYWHR